MPEARAAAADARMVLRVKRKRQDDPIDAFRFENRSADRFTKRRQTNESALLLTDIFHLAETQTEADVSGTHRIIDAEWDASKRLISLKRKHDDGDDTPAQRRRTDPAMNQFAVDQKDLIESPAETSPDLSSESIEDYVYDIYYGNEPKQSPKQSSAPSPSTIRAPPVVGRAQTPKKPEAFSPIPPVHHSTTAPGFEHLDTGEDDDDDWEATLLPVALKRKENGELQVLNATVTDDLVAAESPEVDDDEDSNDEDYYLNDYPDDWSDSGC